MTFELEVGAVLTFPVASLLLAITSKPDLESRVVPNRLVLICGIIGGIVAILTSSITTRFVLHASALMTAIALGLLLHRLGTIGGADFKMLVVMNVTSPGLSFGQWCSSVFEGIVITGLEIAVTLALGYLWWRYKGTCEDPKERKPPLIPLLLMAFLSVQLLVIL